jgi:hypothetical protein
MDSKPESRGWYWCVINFQQQIALGPWPLALGCSGVSPCYSFILRLGCQVVKHDMKEERSTTEVILSMVTVTVSNL